MPQILKSTMTEGRAINAAGETFDLDLPVNPLSHIDLTMLAVNTNVLPLTYEAIHTMLNKYTSIAVRYRGATIIQGSAVDLLMAMAIRRIGGFAIGQLNNTITNVRALTFTLAFGRKLYDALECFPATRRGDLVLSITAAADAAGLDTHTLQIETCELLDAKPTQFVKTTTTTQAMAAAGQNEIDLPIGNKLLGVVLRPFAYPNAALQTSSFGNVALKVDNVEMSYARSQWETLHGTIHQRVPQGFDSVEHIHGFVDAAAGQVNTQDVELITPVSEPYAYMDLDPLDDGSYALDTRGAARVHLDINSDTADGANTSRVLPIELVELAAAA